ncbi:37S ribosomal protein S16, mitochondrial [Cichlidogyrus casuarinus]|uniref:Small ribosomal subunit protein bS16m n=1 Tax=Cichlidogyrus casuarinus TaxID=1844966 RepID=A0ABD2Q031_9PLAT
MHRPVVPNSRIRRMFPVKERNKMKVALVRVGCTNRPFYRIEIKSNLKKTKELGIEQIGSWDPLPNAHGEQLIGINVNRLMYWLGKRAQPTTAVAQLLGLGGFLPIHPRTYLKAFRIRQRYYKLEKDKLSAETNDGENASKDVLVNSDGENLWFGKTSIDRPLKYGI